MQPPRAGFLFVATIYFAPELDVHIATESFTYAAVIYD
jgi:hypothetical protein